MNAVSMAVKVAAKAIKIVILALLMGVALLCMALGIRTRYICACDRQEDLSFITTKWLVVLWILPLVPLKSIRAMYIGTKGIGIGDSGIETEDFYNVIKHVPLKWTQILEVYFTYILYFLLIIFILIAGPINNWIVGIFIVSVFIIFGYLVRLEMQPLKIQAHSLEFVCFEKNRIARRWVGLCYFFGMMFPVYSIIVIFLIWWFKKNKYNYIENQGKEALNFQITLFIFCILALYLYIVLFLFNSYIFSGASTVAVLIFFLYFMVMFIGNFFLSGMGMAKTTYGECHYYPINLRLIR